MDATTLKMAMAGFFHDIGKFADKDTMGVTEQYFNDNAGIYLPFYDGRYSHHHALYTAAFIEQMKPHLPPQLNSGDWGDGDSFINLAAGHHHPETPMQQIITVADWLTSGMDRDEFDPEKSRGIAFRDYRKTRMLPILEQLMRPGMDTPDKFFHVYPLSPLSPETIFPVEKSETAKRDEKTEYRALYDGFSRDISELPHGNENIELWFEHFESLMMAYTAAIPAARAGKVVHDVSLYDHCRLTSAFATALFLYHRNSDTLEIPEIKDKKEQKFILVSGNFFGIQQFIFSGYGDTRKYRSKLLRGRSFYVSLLSELAADMVCRKIGLSPTSVILNAAGRFTVLAPNTGAALKAVKETREEINIWLMKIGFGEISIGFSMTKASHEDFTSGRFPALWEEVGRGMEECKFTKIDLESYGGVIPDYLDEFDNRLPHPLCPLCGKRPADPETGHSLPSDDLGPVCRLCRDHVLIGTRLVKRGNIVITRKDIESARKGDLLMEPVFNHYQMLFAENPATLPFDPGLILKCWDIALKADAPVFNGISRKILNSYVPVYEDEDLEDIRILETRKPESVRLDMIDEILPGEPMSLSRIAAGALTYDENGKISGIDALGVLKADMDYLGMLMGCGLEERRHTISRLATLSRQINYYFALYLPHLLMTDRKFRMVYTVFAGGDDLFLIGPWNRIYELSLVLSRSFKQYVCGNPNITLSAGISLQKAHTPLSGLAASAEEALEKSKSGGRDRLTMFSRTAKWEEMKALDVVRENFESWLEKGWMTKSMLYRLNDFIRMAAMEKQVLKRAEIYQDDMYCLKWRALFYYSAKRNIAKKEKKEKREEIAADLMPLMAEWLEKHEGKLRIPLWNVLYNHR